MKLKIGVIVMSVLFCLVNSQEAYSMKLIGSRYSNASDGVIVITSNFDFTKKHYGVTPEYERYFYQVHFQQLITQELLSEGYLVIERLQLGRIIGELGLDVSGAVAEKKKDTRGGTDASASKQSKGKSSESETSSAEEEKVKTHFTKDDLKKLGQLLGISHMIFYSLIENTINLRVVNLESAEIVAVASISIDSTEFTSKSTIARSIVKAITAAAGLKQPIKRLYFKYVREGDDDVEVLRELEPANVLYVETVGESKYYIYEKNSK